MIKCETVPQFTLMNVIDPRNNITFGVKRDLSVDNGIFHTDYVLVTVLDSTYDDESTPILATLIIPRDRENDWLFNTTTGLLQLKERFFNISRLFVVSNYMDFCSMSNYKVSEVTDDDKVAARRYVGTLLRPLYPLSFSEDHEPRVIHFDDGLVERTVLVSGSTHMGPFVVTDDRVFLNGHFEIRRRLRYKNTADVIHAEAKVIEIDHEGNIKPVVACNKLGMKYDLDLSVTVHPTLKAMKYGIECLFLKKDYKAKYGLSLGTLGGVFLKTLSTLLEGMSGLEVTCVHPDGESFSNSMFTFFGTPIHTSRMYDVTDPMEIFREPQPKMESKFASIHEKTYDILVVDLKRYEFRNLYATNNLYAPNKETTTLSGLQMMKVVLSDDGLLVVHVIPSDYFSYCDIVDNMKQVFPRVFQIKINGDRDVLMVGSMNSTCYDANDDQHKSESEFMTEEI